MVPVACLAASVGSTPAEPFDDAGEPRFDDRALLMVKNAAAVGGGSFGTRSVNGNGLLRPNSDAPPETKNVITPSLSYGGKIQLQYTLERNFDLDDEAKDDLAVIEPSAELAFSYHPEENFEAFLNLKLQRELILREEGEEKSRATELEIDEAYVKIDEIFEDFALQVGRQKLKDKREWLYDQELDAIRVFYKLYDVDLELSVSREKLFDRDLLNADSKDRINNYIAYAEYELVDEDDGYELFEEVNVAAFGIVRDDREDDDNDPVFFGVRSSGKVFGGLDYWADFALVRGKDGANDIRAYGFDVGGTYEFDAPFDPYVVLGYAFGSGDGNHDDGVDRNFRQTDLQGNSVKFGGVVRIKYYGELFDPELSNMSILTAGVGFRPLKRTSIDLIYHHYRLDELSDELRDAKVSEDLSGQHRQLGDEVDLVFAYRAVPGLKVEVGLGYFMPGRAFEPHRDDAFSANIEVEYEF